MARKSTDAQLRAGRKYDDNHCRRMNFKFNLKTDADILEKLDSVPNKQGYLKELIRADIKKTRG